jgi:hypothetical protein
MKTVKPLKLVARVSVDLLPSTEVHLVVGRVATRRCSYRFRADSQEVHS